MDDAPARACGYTYDKTVACASEHPAPSPAGLRDETMDAVRPAATVHYYDTSLHRILCGVRGFDQRSTKHSRDVTCDACVGLLRERPIAAKSASSPAPSSAAS
jgi:hypothetical protein